MTQQCTFKPADRHDAAKYTSVPSARGFSEVQQQKQMYYSKNM